MRMSEVRLMGAIRDNKLLLEGNQKLLLKVAGPVQAVPVAVPAAYNTGSMSNSPHSVDSIGQCIEQSVDSIAQCIEQVLSITPSADTCLKARMLGIHAELVDLMQSNPRLLREKGKAILRPRIILLTHSPLPSLGVSKISIRIHLCVQSCITWANQWALITGFSIERCFVQESTTETTSTTYWN